MKGQPMTSPPFRKRWYQRRWLVILLVVVFVFFALFIREVLIELGKIQSGERPIDVNQFSQSSTKDPSASGRTTVARVSGVDRTDAPYLGGKDAKVVIVEFGDFECPFCQQAFPIVHSLAYAYADRIRFIWRDFPVSVLHPNAQDAAEAGRCALELGGNEKFWLLHDRMFINQEDLSVPALKRYAGLIGLNQSGFDQCLDSHKYKLAVQNDYLAGADAGVPGTPTFFLNGLRVAGAIPEDIFKLLIDREFKLIGE